LERILLVKFELETYRQGYKLEAKGVVNCILWNEMLVVYSCEMWLKMDSNSCSFLAKQQIPSCVLALKQATNS
jgi:hypothetical protein